MKKAFLLGLVTLCFAATAAAQDDDSVQMNIDAIEASMQYQTGVVNLDAGNAILTVPKGFKFLDRKQSIFVLTDLWGNPADSGILGMLVPENLGVLDSNVWIFALSYENMGFVKDDDADDIDYNKLLQELQKEVTAENQNRIKKGFPTVEFVGWAVAPFYDKNKKVLHWAKELKFGESGFNTLNYNLRVLGRKGVFMLNAVANMSELPAVEANMDKVIGCVTFKEGHRYADFNPDVDNVAALTLGGLVAGKILAKVGMFALFAKFWKLIAIGVAAAGAAVWKFFKGRQKEDIDEE